MASEKSVLEAQLIIPHSFQDRSLLKKALTAGDSNSDDREGHRGMAQVGDTLISFVILSEGYARGISRKEQADICSRFNSKTMCSTLARERRLDQMIKISERQEYIGPQPATLKNTLAAIVAAVWLDSRNYHAVVQVMAALGLVNNAEPLMDSQVLTSPNSIPSSSVVNGRWEEEPGDMNAIMNEFDFDALFDTNMFEQELTPEVSYSDTTNDWLAVNLAQDCDAESALAPYYTLGEFQDGNQSMLHEPFSIFDPNFLDTKTLTGQLAENTSPCEYRTCSRTQTPWPVENVSHILIGGGEELDTSNPNENNVDIKTDSTSTHPSTSREEQRAVPEPAKKKGSTKPISPKSRQSIELVFRAYISHEARKLQHSPDLFTQHYGHMKNYQEALYSVKTPKSQALAKMAVAIGDGQAMFSLQKSIGSIRSSVMPESRNVGQTMSPEQRFDAIQRLDLQMSELRLARWLHIFKLYEELSHDVARTDVDGFCVWTGTDLAQRTAEAPAVAQRGNPRNLEQANITIRMAERTSESLVQSRTAKNHLRRVGKRLQLLVRRWGLGVLALLGVCFTDDLIMSVTDGAFNHFVDIVHRFEGAKIRAVSDAATIAVQLFLDDKASQPVLRIEAIAENDLLLLPRLSQAMQALFVPLDSVAQF